MTDTDGERVAAYDRRRDRGLGGAAALRILICADELGSSPESAYRRLSGTSKGHQRHGPPTARQQKKGESPTERPGLTGCAASQKLRRGRPLSNLRRYVVPGVAHQCEPAAGDSFMPKLDGGPKRAKTSAYCDVTAVVAYAVPMARVRTGGHWLPIEGVSKRLRERIVCVLNKAPDCVRTQVGNLKAG